VVHPFVLNRCRRSFEFTPSQLTNVEFEDSKRVADYFKRGSGDITENGVIMNNKRHYCSLHLTNFHVEFTRRLVNEVVHELAKTTTFSLSFRISDDASICINDMIANEML